jgi:hypothetical protein
VTELPDLRDHVRAEAPAAEASLVVRGGPDTADKLRRHAERVRRAFVLDGAEVLGISVFCALDDVGPASLDAILGQKLGTYRWVHVVRVSDVVAGGFELLPTFERPHFTLVLPGRTGLDQLLDTLGREQENPRYGQGQRRSRRRPR